MKAGCRSNRSLVRFGTLQGRGGAKDCQSFRDIIVWCTRRTVRKVCDAYLMHTVDSSVPYLRANTVTVRTVCVCVIDLLVTGPVLWLENRSAAAL